MIRVYIPELAKRITVIKYEDRLDLYDFIQKIWKSQGKTSNNCTGMSSFSFFPERITFVAFDDWMIYSSDWYGF